MGKEAITVIAIIPVTAGTPLVITAEIAATSEKEAIAVIVVIPVIAGTLLIVTAEITATPGTKLD